MSGGHAHADPSNKKIALLIAVMVLFLALAETLAKGSQTNALAANIEASNLWSFFQAKTVRQTALRAQSEAAALIPGAAPEALAKQQAAWKASIDRWESEPDTGEGRKELIGRAKKSEALRDLSMAKYHHFEMASAAFQIAMVLASAAIITAVGALIWVGAGVGLIGIAFMAIGLFAPHAVHIF